MGNSKLRLLSFFVVVAVVSSQNYEDKFIPRQQNNPTATKNIELFMDSRTDCSGKVREVGDKVVNLYGHGGPNNQDGPLSCSILLNTDSPREPKRFKITIIAMRIRSCGVQFYMYDGSDQGGSIRGSFDCNRGMDDLNGFTLYHSTGSQYGFSLTRNSEALVDYDIQLHIEPIIASLDWSEGGGWGTGSIYDVDKFSQEAIVGIIGGAFILCIVIVSAFIACYCLRSKGKTLPPREIILRSDFNSVHGSAKAVPEPSEKVWMSDLSSVGNTMKSTKSSIPPKGRYQPSEDGSNYSDEVPRHSNRYGSRHDRPRRYDDPPRYETRGYRRDDRREPPPRYDDFDDRPPRRFGRPRGAGHSRYDDYDEEAPMNRNRNRPPPGRGQRTDSAFENSSFIEPEDDMNIEKVIEPRVKPKKSTATDPIPISDEENEEEEASEEENEESESESEEPSEEEEESEEEEVEKTEKKRLNSDVHPQNVQLPPQQYGQPPMPQMVMQPQFGTLPQNYQPPPYNVAHTFMPVPMTQQGVPMVAGPVHRLPPRYMTAQPQVVQQAGPNQNRPITSMPKNEPPQNSTPPIYNYLVRRGYTPIDGRSSPVSASTTASNLSDRRPYHTDDSDHPANIDSGVEFMKRTTNV